MVTDLIEILCVGAATAALIMPRACSLRESMGAASGNLRRQARDCRWPPGTAAHDNEPPASDVMRERTESPDPPQAGQPGQHEMPHPPAPRGGRRRDRHSADGKTRRNMAYLLIALLAFVVIVLLAMVAFDVISVDEVKEFGLLLGPLVELVATATRFYFTRKG